MKGFMKSESLAWAFVTLYFSVHYFPCPTQRWNSLFSLFPSAKDLIFSKIRASQRKLYVYLQKELKKFHQLEKFVFMFLFAEVFIGKNRYINVQFRKVLFMFYNKVQSRVELERSRCGKHYMRRRWHCQIEFLIFVRIYERYNVVRMIAKVAEFIFIIKNPSSELIHHTQECKWMNLFNLEVSILCLRRRWKNSFHSTPNPSRKLNNENDFHPSWVSSSIIHHRDNVDLNLSCLAMSSIDFLTLNR